MVCVLRQLVTLSFCVRVCCCVWGVDEYRTKVMDLKKNISRDLHMRLVMCYIRLNTTDCGLISFLSSSHFQLL